ncbi:MAG: tRNA lysidine(34) synthetase TilS [Phycisphaerales bacterium]|jgi:tRNA(Ile)-lysidine synthetase-like protein|nr:tRNA lysidine(34) synthetase TilS [Phycisphaerales bacterium]
MREAIAGVPPGRYAVGVSGGADSVALLSLLRQRDDLTLHIAHLNHQTRGDENTKDAEFVTELSSRWAIPRTIGRLDQIEADGLTLNSNPSARYRDARLAFFGQVVRENNLHGVILAHHADDQAETILQRLLRGSGPAGLGGMRASSHIGGLLILRPLLAISGQSLRSHLRQIGQEWREDASNRSDRYFRNVLRQFLANRSQMGVALVQLGKAMEQWVDWTRENAPELADSFDVRDLADLPSPLALESARKWLLARGVRPDEIFPSHLEALYRMATDAADAPRRHFPGRLLVRRRGGRIEIG